VRRSRGAAELRNERRTGGARRALGALFALGLAVTPCAAPLTVESTPPGGGVFLDDRFVGVTPVTVELDAEGRHLLRVEKRGYAVFRQAVEVLREPLLVRAELAPAQKGRISVTTIPSGAEVTIDGRSHGRSPLETDGLDLGPHTVQAVKTGYDVATEEVLLSPEQPSIAVALTLTARIEDYLVAQVAAHPEDVMSITDLAHEYALQHRFDECLATMGQAFDAVSTYGEALDQDAIRRVYMEIDRLYEKQFDYAPDDVVVGLRPRLLEALRGAIERHPKNGYNYEALADLLTHEGRPDEALQVYHAGAASADGLAVRLRLLGSAGSTLYSAGSEAEKAQAWPAAAEAYERLIAAYPQLWCSANALGRLVEVYGEGLKDPAKAADAAQRLVSGFPRDDGCGLALYRAAKGLADAGQAEQAVALAEEAGARCPGDPYTVYALLRAAKTCAEALKDSSRALALLRQVIDAAGPRDEGAQARREAAALLKAQGDQAGADVLIQEILTQYPLSAEALQAQADPAQRERHRAAAKAYQEASALIKADDPKPGIAALEAVGQEYADTYYGPVALQVAGNAWAKAQDYAQAVAAAEAFAERWPEHPDTPSQLYRAASWLASNVSDPQRALEMYRRIVSTYPTSTYADDCLYQSGQLLMQTSAVIDYQQAMDTFVQLARDYPDSTYATLARKYAADCWMQLREPDKARETYMQLMAEDPNGYVASLAARMYQTVRMRKEENGTP